MVQIPQAVKGRIVMAEPRNGNDTEGEWKFIRWEQVRVSGVGSPLDPTGFR